MTLVVKELAAVSGCCKFLLPIMSYGISDTIKLNKIYLHLLLLDPLTVETVNIALEILPGGKEISIL